MYKIGDVIEGRYKVHEIHGGPDKSGMGIVYACIEENTNIPTALKTFQDKYLGNSSIIKSFKREAYKWMSLDKHPYIVKATYYDEYEYRPYIIMEYIPQDEEGRNVLTDFIYGQIADDQILKWAVQFCIGMSYAYLNGIKAHADIKPDNIMITPERNIKITDFGIAKSWKEAYKSNPNLSFLYSSNYGCGGTRPWMAPEQFDGICNEKSDIYSFGVVLYQLINDGNCIKDSLPFYTDNQDEWENLHKNVSISPLSHELFPIVRKCLEKNPESRYNSFDEMKKILIEKYETITNKDFPPIPTETELETWELSNKGISLIRLGLLDEAMEVLEEALIRNNKNPLVHNNLGLVYDYKGQYDEAKIRYLEALKISPDYPHANSNLGNILLIEGKCPEAIKHFKIAIRNDSNYYGAHFNLGNTYLNCKKPLLFVIKKYLDAININHNYAEAYGMLGVAFRRMGWLKEAEWAYKRAIELKPDHIEPYFNLGYVYELKGENALAIDFYTEFIDITEDIFPEKVQDAKNRISKLKKI